LDGYGLAQCKAEGAVMGRIVSTTLPEFFNALWEVERADVNVLSKWVRHVEEQRL